MLAASGDVGVWYKENTQGRSRATTLETQFTPRKWPGKGMSSQRLPLRGHGEKRPGAFHQLGTNDSALLEKRRKIALKFSLITAVKGGAWVRVLTFRASEIKFSLADRCEA